MAAPKFKVGDKVRVLADAVTPFAGVEGTIHGVQPNDRGVRELDRYIVMFVWGEQQIFYEVQLALADGGKIE